MGDHKVVNFLSKGQIVNPKPFLEIPLPQDVQVTLPCIFDCGIEYMPSLLYMKLGISFNTYNIFVCNFSFLTCKILQNLNMV